MLPQVLLFACIILIFQYDRCEGGFAAGVLTMCSPKNSSYFYLTNIQLRTIEEAQDLKMNILLKEDVSNDLSAKVELQRFFGDNPRTISIIKKKGACDILQTYGGETYAYGARQAKVPNYDKCPVVKGRYFLDWYRLDFNKFPIVQIAPHGKFKVILRMYSDNYKTEVFCVKFDVQKD